MNLSQKLIKLAARTLLLLGLTAGGSAWAACDVSLVSVFANGQAVLKADCGNTTTISQITWYQTAYPLAAVPVANLTVIPTTQDIYYTTAITTGTSTFTATGNSGNVVAGKAATIISGQTTLTVAVGLVGTTAPSGTVTSTPAGFTCSSGSCSTNYPVGTSITLTATPGGGGTSFFSGWGGDCSGTGACVLAMTGPRTVTATFNSAPPPPAPVCSASASPSSITLGTSTPVTFTASCSNSPASYVWTATNNGPAITGNGSTASATFPAAATATYNYSVTATNAGGSGSASTSVTVASTPAPSCTLSASPTSITAGNSSTLTASCPTATSYVWTGGTCAGTTAASCTVTPAATTSYTVAGTNAGGTGAAASATVTVGSTPPPPPSGCSVIEATNYPSSSTALTAVQQNQPGGQDWAFKVTPANLVASTRVSGSYGGPYGLLHFYSGGSSDAKIEIANSPCAFTPAAQITSNTCALHFNGYGDQYYLGSTSTSNDKGLWGSNACWMPAPDANGNLYINVHLNNISPGPTESIYWIYWENGCSPGAATC